MDSQNTYFRMYSGRYHGIGCGTLALDSERHSASRRMPVRRRSRRPSFSVRSFSSTQPAASSAALSSFQHLPEARNLLLGILKLTPFFVEISAASRLLTSQRPVISAWRSFGTMSRLLFLIYPFCWPQTLPALRVRVTPESIQHTVRCTRS